MWRFDKQPPASRQGAGGYFAGLEIHPHTHTVAPCVIEEFACPAFKAKILDCVADAPPESDKALSADRENLLTTRPDAFH